MPLKLYYETITNKHNTFHSMLLALIQKNLFTRIKFMAQL